MYNEMNLYLLEETKEEYDLYNKEIEEMEQQEREELKQNYAVALKYFATENNKRIIKDEITKHLQAIKAYKFKMLEDQEQQEKQEVYGFVTDF